MLLGDVGRDRDAIQHGQTALLGLQEAKASEASAFYALATTARWGTTMPPQPTWPAAAAKAGRLRS
ncbi:MAG: hypothetical protein ACR2FU_00080 [Streptosporangiaceae bacterium]